MRAILIISIVMHFSFHSYAQAEFGIFQSLMDSVRSMTKEQLFEMKKKAEDLPVESYSLKAKIIATCADVLAAKHSEYVLAMEWIRSVEKSLILDEKNKQQSLEYIVGIGAMMQEAGNREECIKYFETYAPIVDKLIKEDSALLKGYIRFIKEQVTYLGNAKNTLPKTRAIYANALEIIQKIKHEEVDLFDIHNAMANHLSACDLPNESLEIFERNLKLKNLKPFDRVLTLCNIALAYTDSKKFKDAEETYKTLITNGHLNIISSADRNIVELNRAYNNALAGNYEISISQYADVMKHLFKLRALNQKNAKTELEKMWFFYQNIKLHFENMIPAANDLSTTSPENSLVGEATNILLRFMGHSSTEGDYFDKLEALDWKDVQAALQPNELAIQTYKKTTQDSIYDYWFCIKKGMQQPKIHCLKRSVSEKVGIYNYSYLNNTPNNTERYIQFKDSLWHARVKEAYDLLNTYQCKHLYIGGIGDINSGTIGCIYNPDKKNFLAEEFTINNLSNIYDLVSLRESQVPNGFNRSVVFYNPDFGYVSSNPHGKKSDFKFNHRDTIYNLGLFSSKEGEWVKDYLQKLEESNEVDRFTGIGASMYNFEHLTKYDIIHLSTHGYALKGNLPKQKKEYFALENPDYAFDPVQASLLFFTEANSTIQDSSKNKIRRGIMTSQDISRMNLKGTQLVMLSACYGVSGVPISDDIYGNYRAFRLAGAKAVIGSSWEVDETIGFEFSKEFYKAWLEKGLAKREALRIAQIAIKNNKEHDWSHPYYWGGFQLWGE